MIETLTSPTDVETSRPTMVRHIVKRSETGVEDSTLCGAPWDRLNPISGDFCEPCVEEYRRIRPGWPLPGRTA